MQRNLQGDAMRKSIIMGKDRRSDGDIMLSALAKSAKYCELEMWGQALKVLESLPVALQKAPEVLSRTLEVMVKLQDWEGALRILRQSARALARAPDAWFHAAHVFVAVGDTAAAGASLLLMDATGRERAMDHRQLRRLWLGMQAGKSSLEVWARSMIAAACYESPE